MQVISSKDNEIIKQIKKLKDKKYRDINNEFIIEGIKLIEEAIIEKAEIKKIIICEECASNGSIEQKLLYEIAKYDCIYVTQNIFDTLTDVKTPQGILAVVKKQNSEENIDFNEELIVVLDDIQDPGNLGTILRTVDSANLKQIIISKGTADPYNPKVVRSTMGAIFRVKIIESENLEKTLNEMKKNKFKIAVTSIEAKESIYDMEFVKRAIVIGNEANGVSKKVIELADEKMKIPMLRKNRKFKCFCSNRGNNI